MEDSHNWFDQGISLCETGDFTGAISAFDKAITFNQSPAEAWCNRGIACSQIGKYSQALHSFDQALLLDPGHENAQKARTIVLGHMDKTADPKPTQKTSQSQRRTYSAEPEPAGTRLSQTKKSIRNPLFAVIFSFLVAGWGQWYNGERWKGLGFFGISIILGILNIALIILLNNNQLVFFILLALGFAIWIYCMYDAFVTAEQINRGETGFVRKSRLFWLPVVLFIFMIVATIMLAAVLASFVFGMAGNIQHTKVVAATAQQTGAGQILVTYQGGQDADQVRQIVVTVTDSEGTTQTENMKPDDLKPLDPGTSITIIGRFINKDHVVATAVFIDGSEQVILDTYI